jgi:hypothetical protein
MNVVKTTFIVTPTDTEYSIPGDWSAQQIKDSYASQVPGIGNLTSEETYEQTDMGTVRLITFKPRTGNKG